MEPRILAEVGEFTKNSAEKVMLRVIKYQPGQRFLDVRVYRDTSQGGDKENWIATPKGICIALELVDDLQEGVNKAKALIDGGGLDARVARKSVPSD